MKKIIALQCSLLFAMAAIAQGINDIGVLRMAACDTCEQIGVYTTGEILHVALLDALPEQVNMHDSTVADPPMKKTFKLITSSKNISFVFFPEYRVGYDTSMLTSFFPGWVEFTSLEFSVSLDGKDLQQWQKISSLPSANDYGTKYKYRKKQNTFTQWKSFAAGPFSMAPEQSLLVKIRKIGMDSVFRRFYIKRIKISPVPQEIWQIPKETGVQAILNMEIGEQNTWLTKDGELILNRNNSLLIIFDKGLPPQRIIEYSFSGEKNSWQAIKAIKGNYYPGKPYYLFIEDPGGKSIRHLYLRYANQPETIRHIPIKIEPRISRTVWTKIAASLVLAFLFLMTGYLFNRKRNRLQVLKLEQKKEELENTLQLLSGQFNPHFLFNTLNSIQNLVLKEDNEKAGRYISTVAGFLRTVMVIGQKEFISLEEELDISETFLQLEQNRRQFHYEINRPHSLNLEAIDFPPLILQPVLENSIHHGLKENGGILPDIIISVQAKNKNIYVIIKDNGDGYDIMNTRKGYGLALVEKRIKVINQKQAGRLSMKVNTSGEGTETIFILKDWI